MIKINTRPVGEIFEYYKIKLQVIENDDCEGCYFSGKRICLYIQKDTGYCGKFIRDDQKDVIFKPIDK